MGLSLSEPGDLLRFRIDLFIGTSGWDCPHWGGGVFYSSELQQKEWLVFSTCLFKTEEINNSFYHLTGRETFEKWRDTVPEGFIFAVKISRFVTHLKKLSDTLTMTPKDGPCRMRKG